MVSNSLARLGGSLSQEVFRYPALYNRAGYFSNDSSSSRGVFLGFRVIVKGDENRSPIQSPRFQELQISIPKASTSEFQNTREQNLQQLNTQDSKYPKFK